MAQARRTRRTTKHRGNAAGVVEVRGRTGRKPTAAEKSGKPSSAAARGSASAKRIDRRDRPPTWRSAFYRAMIAAVILLLVALLLLKNPATAAAYFPLAIILYTPVSYYTDLWMYRRRQRRKAEGTAERKRAAR